MNRLRDYKIFIDGKLAGTVANGQEKSFEVPAGGHTVVAKIDWTQSPELEMTLTEGQDRTLHVGMHKMASWMLPFSTVIIAAYFGLRFSPAAAWSGFLIIPLLGYLIYILTIGRKKYLFVEEQSAGQVL